MNITEQILKSIKPKIDQMVEESIKWLEKQQKRPVTKFDREYTRLSIIYDMVRSIEKYTEPTDELKSISAKGSPKGSIVIDSDIIRDGKIHNMYTSVIFAGGYNIQRLHYRYLTKTTLPSSKTDLLSKQLKSKMNKLSKGERISKDIDRLTDILEKRKEKYKIDSKLSDDEIEKMIKSDNKFYDTKWSELNDYGKKNYGTPENFYKDQASQLNDKIKSWKDRYVVGAKKGIESIEKDIKKYQLKLDSLV